MISDIGRHQSFDYLRWIHLSACRNGDVIGVKTTEGMYFFKVYDWVRGYLTPLHTNFRFIKGSKICILGYPEDVGLIPGFKVGFETIYYQPGKTHTDKLPMVIQLCAISDNPEWPNEPGTNKEQ